MQVRKIHMRLRLMASGPVKDDASEGPWTRQRGQRPREAISRHTRMMALGTSRRLECIRGTRAKESMLEGSVKAAKEASKES